MHTRRIAPILLVLLILAGATAAAGSKPLKTFLGAPWLGPVTEFRKIYPDAARAERTELVNGKVFEDYRVQLAFEGIPVDAAFLFYGDRLFRVILRYKNFKENDVIGILNRLYGDPGGNSWSMVYDVAPGTFVLVDTVDDTITLTDRALGEAWEVQHQETMQQRGYQGRYGGG